uniref:interleukin-20 receptor subunit alpha-like isoform X1 n=2 Tax=Myxine glutinosa TaxID=7769 RepID=UPI00358E2F72
MWVLFSTERGVLLHVLLVHLLPGQCSILAPDYVMVESLDMRHMVHWNSVPGAANYTLQHQISYFRRNNPKIWANVRCPVAHTLQCNVTREMTFGKHYFRVRATRNGHVSNWTESSPFEPTKSTKLSAPRVRMEMKGAVLLVWLDGEAQWLRKELVTKTTYFLYYCTSGNNCTSKETEQAHWTLSGVRRGVTYCLVAYTTVLQFGLFGRPSKIECLSPPLHDVQMVAASAGTAMAMLVVCVTLVVWFTAVCFYREFCQPLVLPRVLSQPLQLPHQFPKTFNQDLYHCVEETVKMSEKMSDTNGDQDHIGKDKRVLNKQKGKH